MIRVFSPVFVCLLLCAAVAVVKVSSEDSLVRKRREWILPPKPLTENTDYTKDKFIAKIRSDYDTSQNIAYFLEGRGASEEPFNVFIVDSKTGLIRVTKVLDREYIDTYNLSGVARYNDGSEAEKRIDLRVKVVDENDNPPVFGVLTPVDLDELSPEGTTVTKVVATDADEPGNVNSRIAYSIVDQKPNDDMFHMFKDGTLLVKRPTLDRETADQYVLTVRGQDLYGAPGGNTGTGTLTINIQDVNDHLPTLEFNEYEGSIMENTQGMEVMRFKTKDLDVENTDNWRAVFKILKGNEAGYFSIKTDPNTNEGVLMLDKAVDYEKVKHLEMRIAVMNKAPLHGGASSLAGNTYPIVIDVKNQPEGPRFDPKVKAVTISEGDTSINIKDFIIHYPAIDGDTGEPAENVRYAKGSDPDNWLSIDPETAEIKLNKMPDRESPFLVNGTYLAEILCITDDMPSKTATGTVAIQVEDFNDHCPELTSKIQTLCITDDAVIVRAEDGDAFPNGPPFHFEIVPEGTQGKWQVEYLNDTAAILRSQDSLWPGLYEVEFVVKDGQGHFCPEPQKVTVQVCTCEDGVECGKRGANGQPSKGSELGPAGIGLLLLGFLMLLLIPLLLLFCQCGAAAGLPGGFAEMPFDTKSHLINYHTEGQGENTEVPLINLPATQTDLGPIKQNISSANNVSAGNKIIISIDGLNQSAQEDAGFGYCMKQISGSRWDTSAYSGFESREAVGLGVAGGMVGAGVGGGIYDGMALPDHILEQYYTQKVSSDENAGVKDGLLVYDFEGQGSAAGSVGCCSLLESDNDLQFLDDLGPKFKTLAEVCGGKKIQTEVKPVLTPLPSASIKTQTSVSNFTTATQMPPLPKLQPTVPKIEQTVITERSQHSKVKKENTAVLREGMTTVNQAMANQGQMLLLQQQQPVFYTTTPMLQPMHYVVQPQVQNTMLLAEAPATNLQGMVLVNGTQTGPAQGMVVQGQTLVSSGQAQGPGIVLVESGGVQGGGANLIHTGNPSGSQTMMVVEGKVPKGSMQVLSGSQTHLVQGGTLQSGGLSGSQRVLTVGLPTSSGGQLIQEAGGLSQKSNVFDSQRVLYTQDMSSGSQRSTLGSSSTTLSTSPTYHKVVVQETREIH